MRLDPYLTLYKKIDFKERPKCKRQILKLLGKKMEEFPHQDTKKCKLYRKETFTLRTSVDQKTSQRK